MDFTNESASGEREGHLCIKFAMQRTLEKSAAKAFLAWRLDLGATCLLPAQMQTALRISLTDFPANLDASRLVCKSAILGRVRAELVERHGQR